MNRFANTVDQHSKIKNSLEQNSSIKQHSPDPKGYRYCSGQSSKTPAIGTIVVKQWRYLLCNHKRSTSWNSTFSYSITRCFNRLKVSIGLVWLESQNSCPDPLGLIMGYVWVLTLGRANENSQVTHCHGPAAPGGFYQKSQSPQDWNQLPPLPPTQPRHLFFMKNFTDFSNLKFMWVLK